jgi:hypothetical protein
MKMVKSLLLGSAAGVVAVAGAQAADLPVKAKPVEYVKICSLYGDGFYYIPGTDVCIRVGGYIISDYFWNGQGNGANQPIFNGANGAFDRTTSQWDTKMRANVQIDTRAQTAYGTLRTFTSLHFQNGSVTDTFNPARAFIQFAGFTFGRTVSFADVPGDWGDAYINTLHQQTLASNTGANGVNQISYTWDLGNGMTLTAGSDERRLKSLSNLSTAGTWSVGADPTTSRAGNVIPDEYLAFKVNQAWGQFGITGIVHQNAAQYYSSGGGVIGYAPSGPCTAQPLTTFCTHANDTWGGAVQSGIWINTPFGNGNQDHIGFAGHYGIGANGYGNGNNVVSPSIFGAGNQVTLGAQSDGVYINGSSIQKTTGWGVQSGYEHWFSPTVRGEVFGALSETSYNNTVKSGRWFCGGGGPGTGALGLQNVVIGANTSCDPGFTLWQVGAQVRWYAVKNFYLGAEAVWSDVHSNMNGSVVTLTKSIGARPTGVYTIKDLGVLTAVFRARRDF